MNQSVTSPSAPEHWLPAVGWEGLYEVSDLGHVRSVPRVVKRNGVDVRCVGRVLRPNNPSRRNQSRGDVYLVVDLYRDGKRQRVRIHLLIAAAFLGPRPEKCDVCHGPGGRRDNRAVNLSYGTRAKNLGPDRRRDGTLAGNPGSRNGSAKLNDAIVSDCRDRAAAGESVAAMAGEFGITVGALRKAVTGQTWTHLPSPAVLSRKPSIHLPGWVRVEAKRRGVSLPRMLDEALESYRCQAGICLTTDTPPTSVVVTHGV